MVKFARLTAVLFGVFGLLWTWVSRPDAGATLPVVQASTRIGGTAPQMTLAIPGNGVISLDSLKGKVVVINFWASWCPPCRAEMAALDQVNTDYSSRDVVVLGVNQMESEEVATTFMREQHLGFALALDTDGRATQQYRVSALPTTYFVDKSGVIRDIVYGGPMTRPLIASKINAILGQ
jgi:cytochrome c biogenesis protein CcmG/thiol:disulfide interchange protein DsbE